MRLSVIHKHAPLGCLRLHPLGQSKGGLDQKELPVVVEHAGHGAGDANGHLELRGNGEG